MTRTFRKVVIWGSFFVTCFALAFIISLALFSSDAAAAEGDVVEFKYPEWVYYDLIYLADDLGYFKDAKVKPKY
ncbi:MAG: hypothetical protein LBQ58_10325, partial [Synergistaceae bacterium]|nr:hypothetical protein [Synergistaceae bacterium]